MFLNYLTVLSVLIPMSLFGQGSGNSLSFNGSDQYIDLGEEVANNCRTIEMWFQVGSDISPSIQEVHTLIARDFDNRNGQSTNEFGLCFYPFSWGNGGKLVFFRRVNSTLHQVFSDQDFWLADHWYHVAVRIDPARGMNMYINGHLQTSTNPSTEAIGIQSGSIWDKVSIGRWGSLPIRYFEGEMDEVRMWSISRSEKEIRENMCKHLSGGEVGLKSYWKMDGNSSNLLLDSGPNGVNVDLHQMQASNRIYSGAPIGDESVYLYPTDWNGQALSLNSSPGDRLTISEVNAFGAGLQIYKVNEAPNSIVNLPSLPSGNYYGVFLTKQAGTFDLEYDYSAYSCSQCADLYSRNDNTALTWDSLPNARIETCTSSLIQESSIAYSYRAEYAFFATETSLEIELGEDTIICDDTLLILDVQTEDANYLWQNHSTEASIEVRETGLYHVLVEQGCDVLRDSIRVTFVEGTFEIELGEDTTICRPESLILDAQTENATYLWQNQSTAPRVEVQEAGLYHVLVENECGMARDSIMIDFKSCDCHVFMANSFSPNQNGLNESIGPVFDCAMSAFSFVVFNRWGLKVFDSSQPEERWDGRFKGVYQPEGVYLYVLHYTHARSSLREQQTGTITLFR